MAITTSPVLAIPNYTGDWLARTDASTRALAGVPTHRDGEGGEPTIAYWSRKLIDVETRYQAYNRELLAVRDAIKY